MVAVRRTGTDTHEQKNHKIGQQVAQRVYGIGNHRRRHTHDAGTEFQYRQKDVDDAAPKRDTIYFFFSVHVGPEDQTECKSNAFFRIVQIFLAYIKIFL